VTRVQFLILISLSVIVSLGIFLELYLEHAEGVDENRLVVVRAAVQQGQIDYNHLQQVANWTGALAERQNDQALRDVLTRNNFQIKEPTAPPPGAPAPAPAAPATR
jgi:hypothetical protein